jgi:hypothetical protein
LEEDFEEKMVLAADKNDKKAPIKKPTSQPAKK